MKIWIDGYEANVPQRLGSGQVALGLIKTLSRIDKKNDYTVILPSPPLDDLPKESSNWHYKIIKPKFLWTKFSLPFNYLKSKEKPDLIFSPTHYIPHFIRVKKVAMIFDLAFLHFPQSFTPKDLWQLKNGSKYTIEHADHIITISNFSKKDIIKKYKVKKDKVTVAYPGYDSSIYHQIPEDSTKTVLEKFKLVNQGFVVFIGTLQPRKNLIRLIDSVARIETLKLVVVGKFSGEGRGGWMYEDILKRPKKLNIEDRVIFTGFIPSDEVVALLNSANSFILPSLWEGFGIPVVEAMACGVPVVVSNVSSLPEVVGDAGLLVNPQSTDQIEQAFRLYLSDKKLRSRKAKLGIKQAKKYSWEKMAKKIMHVFDEIHK